MFHVPFMYVKSALHNRQNFLKLLQQYSYRYVGCRWIHLLESAEHPFSTRPTLNRVMPIVRIQHNRLLKPSNTVRMNLLETCCEL